MLRLVTTIAIFCLTPVAASAQQSAQIDQSGVDNTASVDQSQNANSIVSIDQTGSSDLVSISQVTNAPSAAPTIARVIQQGMAANTAEAEIVQEGNVAAIAAITQENGGEAAVSQSETVNARAAINQNGETNQAGIIQGPNSSDNTSIMVQTGSELRAFNQQIGTDNLFRARQSGSDNEIRGAAVNSVGGDVPYYNQSGAGNTGVVNQSSINNVARLGQNNTTTSTLTVTQTGAGGAVSITQGQ